MLGHYVSDHPLSPFKASLEAESDCHLIDIDATVLDAETEKEKQLLEDGTVGTFAGMIAKFAIKPTKTGKQYAVFTLEDTEGEVQANLFGKSFEENRGYLREDAIVAVSARVERSDRGTTLNVRSIKPLNLEERNIRGHAFEIHVQYGSLDQYHMDRIVDILERYPGRDKVTMFVLQSDGRRFRAELPSTVNSSSGALTAEIDTLMGEGSSRIVPL